MTTHTIRLRGPWQCQRSAAGGGISDTTVALPGSWRDAIGSANEPIRLIRKFNAPTGLDGQQVELCIESCSHAVLVWLNGKALAENADDRFPIRFRVETLLEPQNEVVIEPVVSSTANGSCELGLVSLVIHE